MAVPYCLAVAALGRVQSGAQLFGVIFVVRVVGPVAPAPVAPSSAAALRASSRPRGEARQPVVSHRALVRLRLRAP